MSRMKNAWLKVYSELLRWLRNRLVQRMSVAMESDESAALRSAAMTGAERVQQYRKRRAGAKGDETKRYSTVNAVAVNDSSSTSTSASDSASQGEGVQGEGDELIDKTWRKAVDVHDVPPPPGYVEEFPRMRAERRERERLAAARRQAAKSPTRELDRANSPHSPQGEPEP